MGFDLVTVGSDIRILTSATAAALEAVRNCHQLVPGEPRNVGYSDSVLAPDLFGQPDQCGEFVDLVPFGDRVSRDCAGESALRADRQRL